MKYKLAAADMDGTLLNEKKEITPAVEAAVKQMLAAGGHFCLASGRPFLAIERYAKQLGTTAPVITYNGARVVAPATGEVLFRRDMEPEDAEKVWKLGERLGAVMCLWANDRLFANVASERVNNYKRLSGLQPVIVAAGEIARLAREGVTKILWLDDPERAAQLRAAAERELGGGVTVTASRPDLIEIFDSRVSKASALAFVAGRLGVRREETLAIGDGHNDLPMLEYAGLGVAMANAPDEVRAHCGWVTSSNEEDGVARALERFC